MHIPNTNGLYLCGVSHQLFNIENSVVYFVQHPDLHIAKLPYRFETNITLHGSALRFILIFLKSKLVERIMGAKLDSCWFLVQIVLINFLIWEKN